MKNHGYKNSDPDAFDSNCSVCGGKHRDAIHTMKTQCTVRVICDTGHTWITSMNCCFTDAQRYYAEFQTTSETDDGQEKIHRVVNITEITPGD